MRLEPTVRGPVRVAFIGGRHRSGTTLLELMLASIPGFFAAGELRQIWERGVADNRRCGCGRRFHDCPFWTEVGREAFGGWDALDLPDAIALRRRFDTPSVAVRSMLASSPEQGSALARYSGLTAAVLRAIRSVSGADIVVDSSKSAAHALMLQGSRAADVRLVHMVRDSRGVTYSRRRRAGRSARADRADRQRTNVAAEAMRWLFYNGLTPALGGRGIPYLRIRYEDLVSAPDANLRTIVRHLGADDPPQLPVDASTVHLVPNHLVYGNRLRFEQGDLELRLDEAWIREMPGVSRVLVTMLTAPLLLRYGYPLRRPRRERDRRDRP
jgi:hypothetical protein